MLLTGFCCLSCRQRGLLKEESSNLIAIDVNCWLDVHVSNLHEPVEAGEERELITILLLTSKKSLSLSSTAATMKRKRQKIVWLKPWNPTNKTLEPQNLSVAIKSLSLSYTAFRLLSTYARSRNQIVQYTLRYYCNSTLLNKHLVTCYIVNYDGSDIRLKSRERCCSRGILSRISSFFFCHK